MIRALRCPRTDLPWLLSLHLIAFLGFHVVVEFNATVWFQTLIYWKHKWLEILVGVGGFEIWTLGFSLYFVWVVIVSRKNRIFTIPCLLLAAWTYHEHKYPVATAILVEFDQIEQIGLLVHNQWPPLGEWPTQELLREEKMLRMSIPP